MIFDYTSKRKCTLCGCNLLTKLVNLGNTPIANQLETNLELSRNQKKYPLDLVLCGECGHIQIGTLVDPRILFANYPYLSNSNEDAARRFDLVAKHYVDEFELGSGSFVLEIGSNDGYLLEKISACGAQVLGVDPAETASMIAVSKGLNCIIDFFSEELAKSISEDYGKPDLVIANNVLAHSDDLQGIFNGIEYLMKDETVAILEFSYIVDVYEKLLLDTIYHEHTSYHSIKPLSRFLKKLNMHIFRVERFDTHGGSARIYICKKGSHREIEQNVYMAIENEERLEIHSEDTWGNFRDRLEIIKKELASVIAESKFNAGRLAGYGVPAKFTTLFYSLGLNEIDFDLIVDDNELKIGKFAPGTGLEIRDPDKLVSGGITSVLLFSWNYKSHLVSRITELRINPCTIIIPLPQLEVIQL